MFTAGRPIPVLRTIDSPGSQPAPRKPDTVTPKTAGDSGTTVQRWIDPGPARATTTDRHAHEPPRYSRPGATIDAVRIGERTAGNANRRDAAVHDRAATRTAQRITANTEERRSRAPDWTQSRPGCRCARHRRARRMPAPAGSRGASRTSGRSAGRAQTATLPVVQRIAQCSTATLLQLPCASPVDALHPRLGATCRRELSATPA